MDIGVGALIGGVYRYLFDTLKDALNLKDKAAAWMMIALAVVIAIAYNVFTGGFAGLTFDPSLPGQSLAAIASAWGIIVSSATSLFAVTKKTKK